MGPLDSRVLAEDALRSGPSGFSLALRTPWYRSLPLASITRLEIVVDGVLCPADTVELHLNDRSICAGELPGLHDEWWFMLDDLVARVRAPESLPPEVTYRVEVALDLRIPYLLVGPAQTPLVVRGDFDASLRCR